MHEELTPAKIIERVPVAREVVEAIPVEVLRVIYDPDFTRTMVEQVNGERSE